MKHPYEFLIPFLLLVLFCAFCVRPAHAVINHPNFSNTPYFSGQAPMSVGGTIWANPTPTLYSGTPYIPSATSTNPQGYIASVNGSGALQVTAPTAITVASPAGQSVAPALQTSAALLAGTAIASSAEFTPILTNPAAAISAASSFMIAGGTVAMPFNPLIGGGLVAAGMALQGGISACNAVGCHFLDGLKTQGVAVDAAGVVTKESFGTYPTGSGTCDRTAAQMGSSPGYGLSATCTTIDAAMLNCQGAQGAGYHPGPYNTNPWECGYYGYPYNHYTISGTLPGTAAPATNSDIVAAIAAASAGASGAAFRADMINLSLSSGMAMVADAQTANNVQVASAFAQLSSTTDALGNTIQTLSRNVASIAPGADSSLPSVVTNSVQQVTVTNSVPSAITTTVVAAPAPAQAALDMCVQHPNALGCADISILNDLPAVTPLTDTKNIGALSPVAVGVGFATCPAPIILPGMMGSPPMYLDVWKYPCEFAGYIKPINIIAASIASIYILMGAFKNG